MTHIAVGPMDDLYVMTSESKVYRSDDNGDNWVRADSEEPQAFFQLSEAEASKDLGQKQLTFDWVVLRGDPQRIRIKRLDESGSSSLWRTPPLNRLAPGSDHCSRSAQKPA